MVKIKGGDTLRSRANSILSDFNCSRIRDSASESKRFSVSWSDLPLTPARPSAVSRALRSLWTCHRPRVLIGGRYRSGLQWAQLSSGASVISHFFHAITRILGRGVQRAKEVTRCGCYSVGVTQMVTRIESTGEIQL